MVGKDQINVIVVILNYIFLMCCNLFYSDFTHIQHRDYNIIIKYQNTCNYHSWKRKCKVFDNSDLDNSQILEI